MTLIVHRSVNGFSIQLTTILAFLHRIIARTAAVARLPLTFPANHESIGAKEGVRPRIAAAFPISVFAKGAAEAGGRGETSPSKKRN